MRLTDRTKAINLDDAFYLMEYRWIDRCSLAFEVAKQMVGVRSHEFLYASQPTVIDNRTRLASVLGVGIPTNFFVTDALKIAMEQSKISGVEYFPAYASPTAKHAVNTERYWQLLAAGWGGVIPQEGMQCSEEHAGKRYRRYSGISNNLPFFEPTEWDGSDFFRVWPIPSDLFVTKNVAELFQEWKIEDVDFISLSEFKLPEIAGKVVDVRVQPLMCYLPPKLGEEIGRPLGIDWW